MNTLNEEQTAYLIKMVNLLQKSKIEVGIITETDGNWVLGAMTAGDVYAFIATAPEFPGTITLTRIFPLKARIDLMKSKKDFKVEYELADNGSIKSLTFRAGKAKAGYRCGLESKYQIPKTVFTEELITFSLEPSIINEIVAAIAAFDKEGILSFIADKDSIVVSTRDDNGDKFETDSIALASDVNGEEPIAKAYTSQVVSDLLRITATGTGGDLAIGTKGILCIKHNDGTFYVMPSKKAAA